MTSTTLQALGTWVELHVTDDAATRRATVILRDELAAIDAACSRFRPDSDLSRVNANAGTATPVSPLLAAALTAALDAAAATDGLVTPTLGRQLAAAGYDRDFAAIPTDGPAGTPTPDRHAWRRISIQAGTVTIPRGTALDLGATGKAFAADRIAARISSETGSDALVNLGGDLAVTGGSWVVDAAGHPVSVSAGGLATSSTQLRTWRRAGAQLHHILDPRTGAPAQSHWHTVTVAAATATDANAASTAAVVLGPAAPAWLADHRLPARLVAADGTVTTTPGWPQ